MSAIRRTSVTRRHYEDRGKDIQVEVTMPGGDVTSLNGECVTVDERVMEWTDAGHIHDWFVKNVQEGNNDYGLHVVETGKLLDLLGVCEKVLGDSPLVPERAYGKLLNDFPRPTREELRNPRKVVKNVNTAHKLLPVTRLRFGGPYLSADYDETYLKAVEDTRSWILRMFADRQEGKTGPIYYRGS